MMLAELPRKLHSRIDRFRSDWALRRFRRTIGPGLRRELERRLYRLNDEIGFAGKTILEIGGDLEGKVAKACVALGANHVTSINHDSNFEPIDGDRIVRRRMDATSIDLPGASFDLVLGFAVLEHIRGLEAALASIHRVTRCGGHMVLHGGPLWHSRKGHHLIVVGPSGRNYRFSESNGSENPLAGWEHLAMDAAGLADALIQRGCPPEDADAIVEYVYGTDLLNRYSLAHIKRCFFESEFAVLHCSEATDRGPGTAVLASLMERHELAEAELRTTSIQFLLKKH